MTTKDDSYDENLTAAEAAAREWMAFKQGMVSGGLIGAGSIVVLFALAYSLWGCQ